MPHLFCVCAVISNVLEQFKLEIAVPTIETTAEIKDKLQKKLEEGVYTVGEQIVPRTYEKLIFKDGNIVKEQFIVEGRKQPLIDIREKLLSRQEKYMRNNNSYDDLTEEKVRQRLLKLFEYKAGESFEEMKMRLKQIEHTRHLMLWYDASTVANTGHIIFTINALYDPAIHLTDREYKEITGDNVCVQSIIEEPEIYIVARSRSNDEQLAYVDTRLEDLMVIHAELTDHRGNKYTDIMRFFKGDGPSLQFEAGQQKGGHYYCAGCGVHGLGGYDIAYAFRCPYTSLEARRRMVLQGQVGRRHSILKKPKPFDKLCKADLELELMSRQLWTLNMKTCKDLQASLTAELKGVQRVPTPLFANPLATLEELNLQLYELLLCEPLHDVSKHIENLYIELPHHMKEGDAKLLNEALEATIYAKEVKRGSDFRLSLLKICSYLDGKISDNIMELLQSLLEIQPVLYLKEDQRNPREVLRYHNMSFLHAIMCRMIIGLKLKKLTVRKLYGKYFHGIIVHGPIQERFISGESANAEDEERMFNTVKGITQQTSSMRPGHIIGNLFIRMQAEKSFSKSTKVKRRVEDTEISKISKQLPSIPDTVIPYDIIQCYWREWQAHLERISDFLLPGRGIWWEECDIGVKFYDSSLQADFRDEGPILHHFRSSSFEKELNYLSDCWKTCTAEGSQIVIPAFSLQFDDEEGNMEKVSTNTLGDFSNSSSMVITSTGIKSTKQVNTEHFKEAAATENEEDSVGDEEQIIDMVLLQDNCENTDLAEGIDEDPTASSSKDSSHQSLSSTGSEISSLDSELLSEDNNTQSPSSNIILGKPRATSSPISSKSGSVSPSLSPPIFSETQAIQNRCHQEGKQRSPFAKSDCCNENRPTSGLAEKTQVLQTKLGKALSEVLGKTPDVIKLDKLRASIKENPNSMQLQDSYMDKLAIMQTAISKTKRELEKEIHEWETKFAVEHNFAAPLKKDVDKNDSIRHAHRALQICKALLKEWQISQS